MNSQETAFSPADYRDTIEHLLADTTFGGITPLPATDDRIAAFVAASGRGADTEIARSPYARLPRLRPSPGAIQRTCAC